jgi:hypothetical protein
LNQSGKPKIGHEEVNRKVDMGSRRDQVFILMISAADTAPKSSIGAKADKNGGRIALAPRALKIPIAPQNIIEIPTAMPMPYKVPLFPIMKEKGIAISTITKLEKGNAYL